MPSGLHPGFRMQARGVWISLRLMGEGGASGVLEAADEAEKVLMNQSSPRRGEQHFYKKTTNKYTFAGRWNEGLTYVTSSYRMPLTLTDWSS